MRLIQIHAGLHKTGTTAIQHTLARLAPDLAAHGVALPWFGNRGHWHQALTEFATDPDRTAEAWGKLTRRATRSEAPRILLSSEYFLGADPLALRDALAGLGEAQVRFHIYLRPHIALLTSLYLHRVKTGRATAAPADLADARKIAPEFDHVPAIARLADVFGPDAIVLREFDPSRFSGGSLMSDAWEFLDLPRALMDEATDGGDIIVNPTPTAEQALLLLALAGRLRAIDALAADAEGMERTLALFHDALRARDIGPATPYRLPLGLQRAVKTACEPARAALADRLDRPASAAFLNETPLAPVPLSPIRFDMVKDSLAATAQGLRDRSQPGWADAVDRFAARLTAEPGAAGARLLHLPAIPSHLLEGAA